MMLTSWKSEGPSALNDVPSKLNESPVGNLKEGDDAEAKEKTKESTKRGDKVNRTHGDASLHLCTKKVKPK